MKISVILPVYNKAGYITNMLQDLIGQTFRDFECLIVDDGSTDGSGEICDRIAGTDERLHVFHIPNGGVSHARNFALDRAEGTYITFVDGDDRLAPQYLEDLYTAITESGADLVIGNLQRLWSDGTAEPMPPFPYAGVVPMESLLPDFVKNQTKFGFYGFCVSKIFPRTLAEDIRFDESIRLAEDFDFYLKLYARVKTVRFLESAKYYYMQQAEASSVHEDDRIDYLAQLGIMVHYKQFLCARGAYNGDNRVILEKSMGNYLYYSLYYCRCDERSARLTKLRRIIEENALDYVGVGVLQKWVLLALKHRNYRMIQAYFSLYHWLRARLRGK